MAHQPVNDDNDFRFLLRLARSTGWHEPRELVGVGWPALQRVRKRLRPGANPYGRYVRTRVLGEMRSWLQAEYEVHNIFVPTELLDIPVVESRDIDAEIDAREEVDSVLQRLSPRDRYVLTQRFRERKNLEEIGRDLGVSSSRSSQLLKAALRRFRYHLDRRRANINRRLDKYKYTDESSDKCNCELQLEIAFREE